MNDLKTCEEGIHETYHDHCVYGTRLLRHPSSRATTVSPIMSPVHHYMSQTRNYTPKGDVITISPTVSYGTSPTNSHYGSPMSSLTETPVPLFSEEEDVTFTNVSTPMIDLGTKNQDPMKDNFLVASFNGPEVLQENAPQRRDAGRGGE